MTHSIKLDIAFCDAVYSGEKNFEVRYNDRGYQRGDRVRFVPWKGSLETTHPVSTKVYEITYVLNAVGLMSNYVAFGIKEVADDGCKNV